MIDKSLPEELKKRITLRDKDQIDLINAKEDKYIITLENPIMFIDMKHLLLTRAVGEDTDSFTAGLRAVLR